MSATNVLRFSALGLGIFYGFSHQRSITQSDRAHQAQKEWEHKEKLISDAKAEYLRKTKPETAPKGKSEGKGFDFTSNSSGADFDLESFLHLKDGA